MEKEKRETFETEVEDMGHRITRFDVLPARFQACFDTVFAHCAPIPSFEMGMYMLCSCMLEVGIFAFLVLQELG